MGGGYFKGLHDFPLLFKWVETSLFDPLFGGLVWCSSPIGYQLTHKEPEKLFGGKGCLDSHRSIVSASLCTGNQRQTSACAVWIELNIKTTGTGSWKGSSLSSRNDLRSSGTFPLN
jgi:hypothetical protein